MRRRPLPPPLPTRAARRTGGTRRGLLGLLAALALAALFPLNAAAQRVELATLAVRRSEGVLLLDYNARLVLSPSVEEALRRGVPIYFVAQAEVLRPRWYWRDERVARVTRNWRLSYQPLTSAWRLSLGGLSQVHASLAEALSSLSRASGWRLTEPGQLDSGDQHYTIEFSFQLDTAQLPRPMQIDLGGDWKLGIERTLKVE